MKLLKLAIAFTISLSSFTQDSFLYDVKLTPITIPNMPGIHSFAKAEHNGKWLLIGGRLDGLHARQPWAAFPANQNNTDIMVVDVENQQYWSSSINVLPTSIAEQMQSTNMNFTQIEDTLYIVGGYAYAQSAADHITFPNLTTVNVPALIDAVINGEDVTPFFKQTEDDIFAVTGGHLTALDDTLYIIGGHRFDGRYNPMGHNTYVQTYVDGIRKFTVNNSGTEPTYDNYSEIIDPVHLHRRDYNLVPQIFPNGDEGFMISSGVFQQTMDLPFLYPVDIVNGGYSPNTSFNQYLSNYHSSTLSLHDANSNEMHNLFFGGMSQYYYQNGAMVEDTQVPFVNTISRVTRYPNGDMTEYLNPTQMPGLKGASAEFFINKNLPQNQLGVILMDQITADSIVAGYIVGGIASQAENPFSSNNVGVTSADATIYRVDLIFNESLNVENLDGNNPYSFTVFPNPAKETITLDFELDQPALVDYFITDVTGKIVKQGRFDNTKAGENSYKLKLKNISPQMLTISLSIDGVFYLTKKIIKE